MRFKLTGERKQSGQTVLLRTDCLDRLTTFIGTVKAVNEEDPDTDYILLDSLKKEYIHNSEEV